MTDRDSEDRKEILEHIHTIFKSFISRDRESIKKAHTEDWNGFMVSSTSIERGIDAYMANVDTSFENYKGVGYKIHDSEIQIYDNLAVVYYVAQYDFEDDASETHSLPLRSIDIYRREPGGWIQCGSHITIVPSDND